MTGVQTCALPIYVTQLQGSLARLGIATPSTTIGERSFVGPVDEATTAAMMRNRPGARVAPLPPPLAAMDQGPLVGPVNEPNATAMTTTSISTPVPHEDTPVVAPAPTQPVQLLTVTIDDNDAVTPSTYKPMVNGATPIEDGHVLLLTPPTSPATQP